MVSANQIMAKAAYAISSVISANGNADGYVFYIHPLHKHILSCGVRLYQANPGSGDTLMGYPVKVDPNCPTDRFYFMIPIELEPDEAMWIP